MSIPIRSPIAAQIALRKIAAQASAAPERGAIPNIAAAGYEYGAAMADKALAAKKIESTEALGTQRLNLGTAELAEKGRQFDVGTAEKGRQFDVGTAEKGRQFDTTLSEKNRQFDAGLAQARDYMDQWEKQNKWATVIGVGNLAAQGLGMYAQDKSIKDQALKTEGILKGNRAMIETMTESTKQQNAAFNAAQKLALDNQTWNLRSLSQKLKPWEYAPSQLNPQSSTIKYIGED